MDEQQTRDALRRMQRGATALLAVVALAFVGVLSLGGDAPWVAWAVAFCEGALVGGLADWFAVTALFRHPLGLPIPHTAIIRERKDQFGATLGRFVQDSFLHPDAVTERVRAADVGLRMAGWLSDPVNADETARRAADALTGLLEVVDDDDVRRLVQGELEHAIANAPLAPLAGRALDAVTADGRHRAFVSGALRGAATALEEHRDVLRSQLEGAAPWWLPSGVEHKLFDRLADGLHGFILRVAADETHEVRRILDARLVSLAARLRDDPDLQARALELARDVVEHPELRAWTAEVWTDAKAALLAQTADPSSRLRAHVRSVVLATGARLKADDALRAKVGLAAEGAARHVAEHHADEIAGLITATVARWDGAETSDKLELLLGRDLQFIRINGTVVGGLAGVAIHAIATAF